MWNEHILLHAVSLVAMMTAPSVAMRPCAASEPEVVSVEIVVKAEARVLRGLACDVSGRGSGNTLVPCKNAFVYLQPLASKALKKRSEVRKWARESASGHQPVHREFDIVDGKIKPSAMIIQVGDSVSHSAGGRRIRFEVFKNDVYGITVPSFKFKEPESVPIKVVDPLESLTGACLLVLDHEIAALTDAQGVARFNELPVGFELPMRIFYPHRLTASVSFRSESLEVDRAGRFLLRIDEPSPQRHEVVILADEGN